MIRPIFKTLSAVVVIGFLILTAYVNKDNIAVYIDQALFPKDKIIVAEPNSYARAYEFEEYFVTTDFEPDNYKDLLNIFYTVLNSGWSTFHFYCTDSYKTCVNDVSSLIKEETLLSSVNNYVSPYNIYKTIETLIDNSGKITINPEYGYDQRMIDEINIKKAQVLNQVTNDNMSKRDKIRAIHDYIISTTVYDTVLVETKENKYKANTAYGPLIHGYGICGGYADAMALFLDDLGIPNYKIASENHVWNYLYLDGAWYHLDLTWDDPISVAGKDRIIYTYFLITTEQLRKLNDGNHNYNERLY